MGNYTIFFLFFWGGGGGGGVENPRRDRQARNFTTNVSKILDLKSSSEHIFSKNCRWVLLFSETVTFQSQRTEIRISTTNLRLQWRQLLWFCFLFVTEFTAVVALYHSFLAFHVMTLNINYLH